MVTRGCGGGGGACANTACAQLATTTAPSAANRPRPLRRASISRCPCARLVIDHHAPGNPPDGDGDERLAALGVDDGDVVAEAVGDVEPALVARQRDAPRALADQDVARNLARRHVDDGHMGGVAERDIGGLAVPGHDQADRRDVGLAHAGRQELDLAAHTEVGAVDDIDLARQFPGDPELPAVGGGRETARPRAHHDVLRHVPALGVDQMDEVADLRGDVQRLAILAQQHAFRLGAGRHLVYDDVLRDVDDGERGAFLVGDIDAPALLVEREGLRARAGRELADHLELRHVDDVDHVVVAAGDIQPGAVGAEMHVARAAADLDVLHHLVGLGIDDDEVVGLLVADEDEPGSLGVGLRRQRQRRDDQDKDQHQGMHGRGPFVALQAAYAPFKRTSKASAGSPGMDKQTRVQEAAPALLLDDVVKTYGAVRAVDGVSLAVRAGEFIALLGPNGAGKTTLFQLLSGLFAADSGRIVVMGHDMSRDPVPALARLGIVFQQPTLDLELSVTANLMFHAGLHGMPRAVATARIEKELARLGLAERAHDKAAQLSGGNRRRVELARALLHDPRVLLMDEPTVGLDPQSRSDLLKLMLAMRAERAVAVLWATHLCDEVGDADRVVVLHRGKVLADTTPANLVAAAAAASIEEAFLAMTGRG